MQKHYTHKEVADQVDRHINKYFNKSRAEFCEYVGVSPQFLSACMIGDKPFSEKILSAISFEISKSKYVRAKK